MEVWFVVLVSLSLCFLLRAFFNLLLPSRSPSLPPGPLRIPILGSFIFVGKSFSELEPILRTLHAKYGPMVTLPIGSRVAIFIADRSLAHQALVQNGAVFSDRPKAPPAARIINSNQHNISSAFYGPTWRVLRRNLTSEMLHPTRIKSFSGARKWVLDVLLSRLRSDSESSQSVKVVDHLQYAMFCLLVFMCFGEGFDEKQVKDIEYVQRRLLLSFTKFNVLNLWPRVTRILFRNRWEELLQMLKDRENVMIPLIRDRKKAKEERLSKSNEDNNMEERKSTVSYLDTLLDLQLPEEKRKLEESEMISACSEFLDGGTDTTATALQWILANLVKYPHIQQRLVDEIREVMGEREDKEVKEEDLTKMPYLKAVILEGLRRHPPGHFVLPHAVSEDVVLNDYLVPKNGTVNFMVAEMGWDPRVWENPMEFKPERFLNSEGSGSEAFDITGSKEIKMMPFGVGRRMCPGYNLAMLHLEYYVANLIWNFEWKAPTDHVDLSEIQEFTVVMKSPLQCVKGINGQIGWQDGATFKRISSSCCMNLLQVCVLLRHRDVLGCVNPR
ncbi:cytochrome P450 89A2-like isoform X2 [Prosopis cineraria]|uniref:cytochrome P450 89A2-like isoform X2 n=1 Tax=Prosopis cineraria TaxID=364024 RepID=UPI00240FBCE9|nr:cytochrome P450 89A2-like isoform X2 [Prosopis cineraria]